jgi:LysR family transcriptional regulator, hca operon transcriptional activator
MKHDPARPVAGRADAERSSAGAARRGDLRDLVGEGFIAMSDKAHVLRATIDDYLAASGVRIVPTQAADNPAMVMSLVSSTGSVALTPAYVEALMPPSVVSRPIAGAGATIDLAIGFSRANTSPVLKLFLSRLDQLIDPMARD